MRLLAPVTFVVLLVAAAVAAAAGLERSSSPDSPVVSASSAAGSLSLVNSRGNTAILSVGALAPGGSTSGEVTIKNGGSLPGAFGLAATGLADTPGQGGGVLSQRLQLVVLDVHGSGTVYSGPLTALGTRPLGELAPGESRTYRFTATMPDGGVPASALAGDNAYQGATTTTGFTWTASAADPGGQPGGGGNPGGGGPSPGDGGGNPGGGGNTTPFSFQVVLLKKQPPIKKRRLAIVVTCNRDCQLAARMRMTRKGKKKGAVTGAARKPKTLANRKTKLVLKIPKRAARKIAIAMRSRKGAQMSLTVSGRANGRWLHVKRGVRLERAKGGKVQATWMGKPGQNRAKAKGKGRRP